MRRVNTIAAAAVTLLLASARPARAAGYLIGEQSASATGMAGAFTAKADDASAVFYNPAGLARQYGLQLYVGGMLILGRPSASDIPVAGNSSMQVISVMPGAATDQDGHINPVFIPNVYISYGLPYHIAVGAGFFTNVGLKASWPEEWAGRSLSTYATLETVTLNPAIAWSPSRWFSVGAGVDLTWARAKLRRIEDLVGDEAKVRFAGNDFAVSGNLGVLFQVPGRQGFAPFSFGAHWRARYNFNFDNSDGAIIIDGPPELSGTLHDTRASARVPVPDILSFGAGVRPVEPLFVQVQFDFVNWSRVESLRLTAPDNPQLDVTIPQNWKNGYTLRFGGEYRFETSAVRVGFAYDWSPVPESTLGPIIPDSSRYFITVGGRVDLPKQTALEAAVGGVIFRSRHSTLPEFPVEYSNWALLISLGLSFHQ